MFNDHDLYSNIHMKIIVNSHSNSWLIVLDL